MSDASKPPLKIGVVMDPIAGIKVEKDSTLAMLRAAQARGHELSYLTQDDLSLKDGVALGNVRSLQVRGTSEDWFTLGEPQQMPLSALDVILMRKDPPFDMEFVYTTYLLERAGSQGTLVVNHPQALRDMNEKVYTAWFPQCCVPTLIARDMRLLDAFIQEHGESVVKPLDGMGGRSIFVVGPSDKNRHVVLETLTGYGARFAMVQRYIPDIVKTGDSRVLLIDGEPVPYALARIPKADDNRGNLAAGATGVGRPLTERDRWLAGQIGPVLASRGILFAGLDVIGGFVTEINVTSPTGIRELDRQFGIDIGALLIEAIERHCERHSERQRPAAKNATQDGST